MDKARNHRRHALRLIIDDAIYVPASIATLSWSEEKVDALCKVALAPRAALDDGGSPTLPKAAQAFAGMVAFQVPPGYRAAQPRNAEFSIEGA
jgi:hypothetical protein